MNEGKGEDPHVGKALDDLIEKYPEDHILIMRITVEGLVVFAMFGCPKCIAPAVELQAERLDQEPHNEKSKVH